LIVENFDRLDPLLGSHEKPQAEQLGDGEQLQRFVRYAREVDPATSAIPVQGNEFQ